MFRKHLSLSFQSIILLLLAIFTFQNTPAQSDNLQKDLNKELKRFTLIQLEPGTARQQADQFRKLNLQAEGRDFELSLEPNDLRAPGYHAEETRGKKIQSVEFAGVSTFKGKVAGDSRSAVRIFIGNGRVEGYFFTGDDKFYVEPASNFSRSAGANDLVVYRAEDVVDPQTFRCDKHVQDKMDAGESFVAGQIVPEALTYRVLDIATDADFEFVTAFGGSTAANADILNSLNMIEGVYENELGITFNVTFQHTWATDDPFDAASIDGVMRQFQFYWNNNFPSTDAQYPRDTAHLWSDKSYARGQGWAMIDVVCNKPLESYGVTGKLDWVPAKYMLSAHEIAHNLAATHVEAAQSCGDTLMNAQLTTVTPFTFCTLSREQITGHINDQVRGACMSTRTSAATRFDFDGDSKADISIFRPSNGTWYILNSGNSSFSIFQFGQNGDKPIPADFDGDGKTDAGVYRQGGWFRLNSATGAVSGISFGTPTDIPAHADFDGDGKTDVAVFRPSDGRWFIYPAAATSFYVVQFGMEGDIPIPGDYDGDGKADVNVFRPMNGTWYRLNSRDNAFVALQFGQNGDEPQLGDFDGDGRMDQTIYRNGSWYVFHSTTNAFGGIYFGLGEDKPIPADFDGDGKTDFAVFRPSNANWYKLQSQDSGFYVYQFGTGTDIPALAR